MPASALRDVDVDRVAVLRDIPALLTDLVGQPAGPSPTHLPGELAEIEGDEPGVS